MKRISMLLLSLLPFLLQAKVEGDGPADQIAGVYSAVYEGEESQVCVFKEPDNTYTAKVIWVKEKYDKDGNLRTDIKNPDKSLRNTPCDQIVLIKGMSFNPKKGTWGETKVYDPVRGIKAHVTCSFENEHRLRVRGSLMGIGASVYWEKIK